MLVATDFDGTLATIADAPDGVLLDESARALLRRLAARAQVAVLSGRRLRDLAPHVDTIAPVWLAAEHGAELIAPGERPALRKPSGDTLALGRSARELVRVFPGVHVEVKNTSVAVHYRNVEPRLHRGVLEGFHLACELHGAAELSGRCVVEGRFSREDKGSALRRILDRLPPNTFFVYAGDDTTDDPALLLAAESNTGLGFYVRSDERPEPTTAVDAVLGGPSEWMTTLEALATALESNGQHRHAS